MIFVQIAMDYYGLILLKLRPIVKIEDTEMAFPSNDVKLSNSVIKIDRLMLAVYLIIFGIFNVFYFIIYFPWYKQNILRECSQILTLKPIDFEVKCIPLKKQIPSL